MRTASVELHLEHAVLMIGVAPQPEALALPGAATASSTQVLVRVRAQIAPVLVSFWSDVTSLAGTLVAETVMQFPTTFIHVFDVDKTAFFTRRVGGPGPHTVQVGVDDPGAASRVHILVDPPPGFCFQDEPWDRLGSAWSAGGEADLELLLTDHDRPAERLAMAIELIARRDAQTRTLLPYHVEQLVEWMRWLTPTLSLQEARAMGSLIREGLATTHPQRIAHEVSRRILR